MTSSVESQKGVNDIQRCSVENQKGTIDVTVYGDSALSSGSKWNIIEHR